MVRERFTTLLSGVAAAPNLLSTWTAWRADPQRCRLHWLLWIVPDLASAASRLEQLRATKPGSQTTALAAELLAAWPPHTPNLHNLDFDAGQVRLLLAPGRIDDWLRQLRLEVDAFVMQSPHEPLQRARFKALARLAAPQATLTGAALRQAGPDAWQPAGFAAIDAAGPTPTLRYAPGFVPRRRIVPGTGRAVPGDNGTPPIAVIGAGLAGCATAWALASLGLHCTLFDRRSGLAQEGSGNPAGLFHGSVNPQDGQHARLGRAAALQARDAVQIAIDRHGVRGSAAGLLRLEFGMNRPQMSAVIEQLGLPPTYVRAVDRIEAEQLAGIDLPQPAWFYPGGGWVQPAGLARSFVERAGRHVDVRPDVDVQQLQRSGDGWRLLDQAGRVIADAPMVVLANAGEALRLLGHPDWPVEAVRGQLSIGAASALSDFALPRVPVAGAGYLLPAVDGSVVFGATAHPGDHDAAVRPGDQQANLAQLARLLGHVPAIDARQLGGRVGWRWVARDRLPVIGAVPTVEVAGTARTDAVRFVPRQPGLFVFTALGARGIGWAALGARLVAALIAGTPAPLEAGLCDAVDPARFALRRRRGADRC